MSHIKYERSPVRHEPQDCSASAVAPIIRPAGGVAWLEHLYEYVLHRGARGAVYGMQMLLAITRSLLVKTL